ncbi:DUF2339 domain-containing protein [Sporosarcina siberiensis]|uniref:DUF2339 domain-containing protein n=1 Tax=Sporosarcina siberiensis TaxID=1365606 RepID=A0ABW4SH09_9BACL
MNDNEDILKRLEQLEAEMKVLKKQQLEWVAKTTGVNEPMKFVSPTPKSEKKIAEPHYAQPSDTTYIEKPIQEPVIKNEFNLERALSTWLPRVFMFILLLGVLWGLKLGVDYGIVTNPVRIGLGYAGTVLLYFLGMRYYNGNSKVFGLTLLGGLIALGILTTFAGHQLYGYFNFTTAFILGVAYIGIGVWLSQKTKSETLTIFSAIGGFLLPYLLEGQGTITLQFCAYILILFLSLFYVSLRQKQKYTFYITFLLFHLTLVTYSLLNFANLDESIVVGTVLMQHSILLFFYLKGTISRHVFSEALIYSNFAFALGWVKLLETSQEIVVYGFLAVLYTVVTVILFVKKDTIIGSVLSAVSIFAISAFVLSFGFSNGNSTLLLLLVNGAVGLWVGLRFNTIRTIITSSFIYGITAYSVFFTNDLYRFYSLEHALWLLFLGTMVFIYYSFIKFPPSFLKGKLKRIDQSLIIGQLIVMNYVVRLTNLTLQDSDLATTTINHIFGLVLLATLGAMYFIHKWQRGRYVTYAVLIEFFLLGVAMLTFTLSNPYAESNHLFNLLVELIYVAILITMFISVMKERFYFKSAQLLKKIPLLALCMQIILFLFLNKWYVSTALYYELNWEYSLLIHTFLLFSFSFVSITLGGKMNWRHVRLAGVWLIVVCIIKLFFVDLVSVSIVVRAIMFIIVGIVGLIYSKTLTKE